MSRDTPPITVVAVSISEKKGTPKHPVPEIVVDRSGVVGDAHAGPWGRQVSLLPVESIERFSKQIGRAVRPGEFAENVTLRGIESAEVGVLDRLRIGPVELEVTQIGKECHGDQCAIFREVGMCVMPRDGVFCRVLAGGKVRAGDTVEFVPRPLRIHVVTLSDRASRGEYEDRSGPRICDLVREFLSDKRWHPRVSSALLPDDAGLLTEELQKARAEGVDVVFTTGGTGIGPRDVTPDVVLSLADKTIPGIMEYIRVAFGREHPNARLSRSVAAVMGATQVYALPGSVRAVEEYLGEILKTLEHAILMLHGIDAH